VTSIQSFLHSEAEMCRETDRLTDTVNVGKSGQHLMHWMRPNNSHSTTDEKEWCGILG